MAHDIDGFVLPVPRNQVEAYRRLVEAVAAIWKEHGALDYREFVGDDLMLDGTRSFADVAGASVDDVIVFGWVAFESREARDVANERVATNPRMARLIDASNAGFDARRMVYGGFRSLVPSVDADDG